MIPALRAHVDSALVLTQYEDRGIPCVVKRVNPTLSFSYTVVVSSLEPIDQVLPLNVIWLCMDKSDVNYKKFLQRQSKLSTAPYRYTWIEVTSLAQFNQAQYYAIEDKEPQTVSVATDTVAGVARLTTDPDTPVSSRFVSVTDSRLSDARTPLEHDEMHNELPLTQVVSSESIVTLSAPTADTAILVANSNTDAVTKPLTVSDLGGV